MSQRQDWPEVRLSWVASTLVPQRDKPLRLDGPIPWVRIEDFDGKYLRESKSGQGVTPQQVADMPLRMFPTDTVVCSCSCTMGATAIAAQPLITNQTFIGLVPSDQVLPDFLYYLLQGRQDELQAQASGAIQQYLSKDEFRSLRFPLPSLSEQARIADFLDDQTARIDQMIAARRQQLSLVQAGVRSEAARLFELEPRVPLRYLVSEARVGIVVRPSDYYTEDEDGIPALRGTDVHPFRVSGTDLVKITPTGDALNARSKLRQDDVVLVRTGDAGAAARVPAWAVGFNAIDLVILRAAASAVPAYLEFAVNAARWGAHVNAASAGSIQQHFGVNSALGLKVPALSYEEQLRTSAGFARFRAVAEEGQHALGESIGLLQELRRSLISAAVSGEFDVSAASGRGVSA